MRERPALLRFSAYDFEEIAAGVLEEQLAITHPPQACKLQELVDSGLVLARQLRSEPLVRASVGLALDKGPWTSTAHRPPHVDRPEQAAPERGEDQSELLPHVDVADTAELLVGTFSGVQLLPQLRRQCQDLERRVVVMFERFLPSIAVPAVLTRLDITLDRAQRILAELGVQSAA